MKHVERREKGKRWRAYQSISPGTQTDRSYTSTTQGVPIVQPVQTRLCYHNAHSLNTNSYVLP